MIGDFATGCSSV
ncbi:hypothetical protein AYI69_g11232, partial [Smittium culicis]